MATTEQRIEALEKELDRVHEVFKDVGVNSRGTTDVFGRKFVLPVDNEHKATVFQITPLSAAQPHMRAFWAATFGFFSSFFSVFAPAAIMPYITRPVAQGGLALTRVDAANSGALAVTGTIFMRLISGPLCDKFGARKTMVFLLWLAIPGIVGMMFTTNGAGFIACRFFIGLGLATFVTCQVWCSMMFAKSIVGFANATAGGWGNLGGGVTQILMPQIMGAFLVSTSAMGPSASINASWRLAFIVPLMMHVCGGLFILSGRDLPDGNFKQLELSGAKQKGDGKAVAKIGFSNVNAWIMLITYGLCFGVELTMNNKAATYFNRYHGQDPAAAGAFASIFGFMNLFARSWGGLLSDAANKRFGMRGRIWSMWVIQTAEGFMCIILGLLTLNLGSPDDPGRKDIMVNPVWKNGEDVYTIDSFELSSCSSYYLATPPTGLLNGKSTPIPSNENFINVHDPDMSCIHNSNSLGIVILVLLLFSVFVQMAEGLHYGIVPSISRVALGVCSGMVGAGGNLGAVVGSRFIVSPYARIDQGFIYLGIVIIVGSMTMFGIYFPEHGGMLFPKGGLGSYDPQIIQPPANMRGADMMDYASATVEVDKDKNKA